MTYFIYNKQTGLITKKISNVLEETAQVNTTELESYLSVEDAEFQNNFTHVIGDVPVLIPVIKTLDEVKEERKLYIKQCRDNTLVSNLSSYTTHGLSNNITINARRTDLDNAQNLLNIMIKTNTSTLPFICFDNTQVILTLSDVEQLVLELQIYGASIYQKKTLLDAQINSATSIEEVANIVW